MEKAEVILCGLPIEEYDATLKSTADDKCPHCGGGPLYLGYGLAAGGIGSYSACEGCNRFCNLVSDEGADE